MFEFKSESSINNKILPATGLPSNKINNPMFLNSSFFCAESNNLRAFTPKTTGKIKKSQISFL
jgi:hypothetical protein